MDILGSWYNTKARLAPGFLFIKQIIHLKAARENVDFCLESMASAGVLLVISLAALLSVWMIFTVCRTAIEAISNSKTITVRVFPFIVMSGFKVFFYVGLEVFAKNTNERVAEFILPGFEFLL